MSLPPPPPIPLDAVCCRPQPNQLSCRTHTTVWTHVRVCARLAAKANGGRVCPQITLVLLIKSTLV